MAMPSANKFAYLSKNVPRVLLGGAPARCVLVMTATLASYGLSLAVEHWADQHVDLMVLAVAVTVMLARHEIERPARWRALPFLTVPAAAAAASYVGQKMALGSGTGDALFALALGGCIAARRFGAAWAEAGALATLPFVAALVTPFTYLGTATRAGWSAAIGLGAVVMTGAAALTARRLGLAKAAPPRAAAAASRGILRPSDKMAIQMAAAVGAAFLAGRHFQADHWQWPVLTAFIVCSGNRGRGDVLLKGTQRAIGASIGTAAATLLANDFGAGDKTAVIVIFCILALAVWLRPASYAYWAACITAALALVYGYFGQGGISVLEHRLEGIAIGAALGIAVSWYLLPIRTTDVLRRRTAALLASVADLLTAIRDHPAGISGSYVRSIAVASAEIQRAARPVTARARLARALHKTDRLAGLPDAARKCQAPAGILVELTRRDPGLARHPAVAPAHAAALANVGLARKALISRTIPELREITGTDGTGPDDRALRALACLSEALKRIAEALCKEHARAMRHSPRSTALTPSSPCAAARPAAPGKPSASGRALRPAPRDQPHPQDDPGKIDARPWSCVRRVCDTNAGIPGVPGWRGNLEVLRLPEEPGWPRSRLRNWNASARSCTRG
jgi:Fusaric acid resistance protein-like